ncbi:MAG: phosphate acyltransferase, partial [Rickettsiales bacterium]|nr:phosphate acyltransferase [Rickettsiales bacterium]
MPAKHAIAVDAMGGDFAPDAVIGGLDIISSQLLSRNVVARVFGDKARIDPLLAKYPGLCGLCEVIHSPDMVAPDDKPSRVIRGG